MKTSHLILFLILFWVILLFYKRREYFSHSSNMPETGKVKLSIASLKPLLKPSVPGSGQENNRYQQLYDQGSCTVYNMPPTYARPGTEQAGNIKFCQCPQDSGVPGGLIAARNMPNSACSKDDFTRGGTI